MEDYRASHTAPDKGATYAAGFEKKNNFGFVWEWEQQALAQIMDELGYQASERHGAYLDFACGTGRIIGHLAGRFEQATGVDVSESMLEQARQRSAEFQSRLGDAGIDLAIVTDESSIAYLAGFWGYRLAL